MTLVKPGYFGYVVRWYDPNAGRQLCFCPSRSSADSVAAAGRMNGYSEIAVRQAEELAWDEDAERSGDDGA